MLSATGISKKYGSLEVLRHVGITIPDAQMVAIVGPSGAGKSTLMHILGMLDIPDTGTVEMDGRQLHQMNKREQASFRNKNMGFVFQFHHLLPEFTALENVAMPLRIAGINTRLATEQATEMLHRVGLGHRLNHRPTELSGGEQQRTAIARAVVHQPSIVFADEPTGNLDTENAAAVHKLFQELKNELGLTLVLVTHNIILAQLADRTISMKDGKIISDTLLAEV